MYVELLKCLAFYEKIDDGEERTWYLNLPQKKHEPHSLCSIWQT